MLKKLHLYTLLLCALISFGSYAQTYPISISTQLSQPSPIYLSNYADAATINSPIKIQLVLNDLTISNRQVRLKIYFQGNGISFSTNDFVVGSRPLYLEGGFPLQLTNVDLAPYFEYQNLSGLNPNQYAQPLPEGIYNIYVEVYDFATGKKLSNKTGSTTIIFQNDPPFLNLPLHNASIMQQNIQNIIFSWTPRSINISNVEYEFSLVEIWDKYTPIQNAFAYSPPLYTATTRTTTLQYGINEPQLIPGKKYAWRIKAKAILGAEEIGVFKNNGYSEIFSFDYEIFCTAPLAIKTSGVSENQAKIEWSGNIDNYDYQVNYREKNANSEWYKQVTPRENITLSNLKPNTNYEYTVGSSCDVGKYTHSTVKEFTTIARDEIAFASCGIKPDPNDLTNTTPLPELFPNDVVSAGDFPIVVIKATGSNGTFSGEGYVTFPFLEKFRKLIDAADNLQGIANKGAEIVGKVSTAANASANLASNAADKVSSRLDNPTANSISNSTENAQGKVADIGAKVNEKAGDIAADIGKYETNIGEYTRVRITFNNIGINTDFKLISGEIIASYDPEWKGIADLDKVFDKVFGSDGIPIEGKFDYEVIDVKLNADGSTTIIGKDGQTSTIAKSPYERVYTDSTGKVITIPANGAGAPNITTGATGGKATAANTNGMSANGEVIQISSADVKITFKNGDGSKYAYDVKPDFASQKLLATYETIPMKDGGVYNLDYKAVSDIYDAKKFPETIIAKAEFKNGKTKDDIVFKTNAGAQVNFEWKNDDTAIINVEKTLNFSKESIIATVKGAKEKDPKDATKTIEGKSEIAGKINLWQMAQKPVINVTLLSVNGASTPSIDKAKEFLNDVYNTVGIKFEVTTANVEIEELPNVIQCGDSDIFNFYSDGQKKIIGNIESSSNFEYNDKTYYVIYTGKSGEENYKGFMPLGGQYAFVFKNGNLKTAAHELGHGIFGLKHPFSNTSEAEKTDLLMDYKEGTLLSHNDWDIIHSGGWKFYGFQKSSSGASQWVVLDDKFLNLDKDSKDKMKGSFSFLSYHGEIITLEKANLEQILFNYGTTDYQLSGKQAPGVLQSFLINKNGTRTYYTIDLNDGKYKDEKGIPYQFPDIKPAIIDGVIAFIPCGADGKTYKFKKSNLATYTNENAKVSLTAIDEFPFVPFSSNNPALETAGVKISQSFKLADEGLRFSYDQNTVDMSKDYCEKPELFYILKIAQIRKNYPEAFNKFTDVNKWENPINTPAEYTRQEKTKDEITYDWANFLEKNSNLQSDYNSKRNLQNYFKLMYKQFGDFIQIQNTDNEGFWDTMNDKTLVNSIISNVKNESIVELEKRPVDKKIIAIKSIQASWVVNEEYEKVLLKLFESITSVQSESILTFLNTKSNDVPYLKALISDIDNKYLFFGDNNRAKFVNTLIKIWTNAESSKNKIQTLKNLLSKAELTPTEAKTILGKTINYNYKSIYARFWTHIKSSNLPAYEDLYVKTEATYDNNTKQIKIETLLALGFVSMSEIKKPVSFDPFEPIIFTNNSTLTAFNEVTESKENLYLPAFIVYYADKEAGIQTASDVTQTAVDVATLVIPGGQLSTIGKVLFYADKVSSVTSIAARATAENNPEFSKIAGLVSIATGIASASTMVLKPSILKIDDYSNLLESINKSSNISAIAKEDRLLVEAFIEKTKSTLISEGKFDGAMTLKYDNAISKLRLGVNITNQESMVSRLISNYPKLENILSKTKNQLTFESATGILKYNGKAIANITTDAKDVVLSSQKVANIDRTATNMEAFTEEAAIFCKNGNCDLVLGGCLVGSTLVKTKKGMTPIADINESDEVWSYNESTKTNIWSTVVQKVNLATQKLYQIVVKNDTIKATSEHPFYTKKGWINANLITKGMMVLLANGTWNTVEANIPKDTIAPVFNIEVVPAHTFYIGNEQVLVHNGFECFKTKFKNLANASDEFFEDFRGNISLLEKFDKGELSYQSWFKLNNAGSKFVKTSVTYLEKFSKLSPEVQSLVCKLTDGASGSTLTKFLDDCDGDFINLINSDKRFAEGIVGHKNQWTRADYENLGEEVGDLTSSSSETKLKSWINRSSKLSNFGEVVATGNKLSANITEAIKLQTGTLFDNLASNLGLTIQQLKQYNVLTEVPLETTGGFMRADIILIKKNVIGNIDDVIIIENKLSATTAFTKRQKEGFGAIINGQTSMNIKYNVNGLLATQGPLTVSNNKIFKISDAGTDNIANVTITKITKVN